MIHNLVKPFWAFDLVVLVVILLSLDVSRRKLEKIESNLEYGSKGNPIFQNDAHGDGRR